MAVVSVQHQIPSWCPGTAHRMKQVRVPPARPRIRGVVASGRGRLDLVAADERVPHRSSEHRGLRPRSTGARACLAEPPQAIGNSRLKPLLRLTPVTNRLDESAGVFDRSRAHACLQRKNVPCRRRRLLDGSSSERAMMVACGRNSCRACFDRSTQSLA
jgi:hypothetical protein